MHLDEIKRTFQSHDFQSDEQLNKVKDYVKTSYPDIEINIDNWQDVYLMIKYDRRRYELAKIIKRDLNVRRT